MTEPSDRPFYERQGVILAFAIGLSAVLVVAGILVSGVIGAHMAPNEWGDTLAGIFSPAAWVLLFATLYIQALEFRSQRLAQSRAEKTARLAEFQRTVDELRTIGEAIMMLPAFFTTKEWDHGPTVGFATYAEGIDQVQHRDSISRFSAFAAGLAPLTAAGGWVHYAGEACILVEQAAALARRAIELSTELDTIERLRVQEYDLNSIAYLQKAVENSRS